MVTQSDIQAALPLTETTFAILLSLAPRAKHGYAVLKDVKALSDGRIVLATGTLYGALKRLLKQGWIARVKESDADKTGRIRNAYALTEVGRRILEAETERLQVLVMAARMRAVGERL